MITIRGWAKFPHRTKPVECQIASNGLEFEFLGAKPRAATICFSTDGFHGKSLTSKYETRLLEITITDDSDARRIIEAMQDFLDRRNGSAVVDPANHSSLRPRGTAFRS